MTTWTTFETIDESQNWDEFYIDRLGVHQYRQDERTRFEFTRHKGGWVVVDSQPQDDEGDLAPAHEGTMRECVEFMSARILYGA